MSEDILSRLTDKDALLDLLDTVEEGSQRKIDEAAMRELESYYALDRAVPVGYLQWLGLWPRETRRRIPFVPEKGS